MKPISYNNRNRNRKLEISTAPTKAQPREPACSQKYTKIYVKDRMSGEMYMYFELTNSEQTKMSIYEQNDEHSFTHK